MLSSALRPKPSLWGGVNLLTPIYTRPIVLNEMFKMEIKMFKHPFFINFKSDNIGIGRRFKSECCQPFRHRSRSEFCCLINEFNISVELNHPITLIFILQ